MIVYMISHNSIDWSDGRAYIQKRAFDSYEAAEAAIRREHPTAFRTGPIEPYYSIYEIEVES